MHNKISCLKTDKCFLVSISSEILKIIKKDCKHFAKKPANNKTWKIMHFYKIFSLNLQI